MTPAPEGRSARIRALNDDLRRTGIGGQVMITTGIRPWTSGYEPPCCGLLRPLRRYGEHDCASLEAEGYRVMSKIDYYDTHLRFGSPAPTDPSVTRRVMTIMLASEY